MSKAEADEARAAAETATPRMQATSRFGVCCLPAFIAFLCMHKTCFPKLKSDLAGQLVNHCRASLAPMLPVLAKHKHTWTCWLSTHLLGESFASSS